MRLLPALFTSHQVRTIANCVRTKLDNTRRARVAPKELLCREVQLNSVPAQRQFAIIHIKLTFSPQAALVGSDPVFGPEGSALHAKRSKSWPKTGPRTDFVTSDACACGCGCGYTHGQTNMFFQTPLHNSPFGAII